MKILGVFDQWQKLWHFLFEEKNNKTLQWRCHFKNLLKLKVSYHFKKLVKNQKKSTTKKIYYLNIKYLQLFLSKFHNFLLIFFLRGLTWNHPQMNWDDTNPNIYEHIFSLTKICLAGEGGSGQFEQYIKMMTRFFLNCFT